MDNTRLTIACEENREGGYEIDVTFERDSRIKFREAFISLDRPMPPYLIEESDMFDYDKKMKKKAEEEKRQAEKEQTDLCVSILRKNLKKMLKMGNNPLCTSLEQSQRLVDLGINTKIADMSYVLSRNLAPRLYLGLETYNSLLKYSAKVIVISKLFP